MNWVVGIAFALCVAVARPTKAAERFLFESVKSLDEMHDIARKVFSSATTREQVRAMFVDAGGATLVKHPRQSGVEKYLYDINLCSYYVWRWNISADFAADGRLKQLYVNGEPSLGGSKPQARSPSRGPFYKLSRARPEAFKGEKSLAATISDSDRNLETRDDQIILFGVGPTRVDPLDMGVMHPYQGEVWRSIFDRDDANVVVAYAGDCAAVDAEFTRRAVGTASTTANIGSAALSTISPPPPARIDEDGVRAWLNAHIDTKGWTLITADGVAAVLGNTNGAKTTNGLLTTYIRHEYYRPLSFGDLDSRSNLQTWEVDCAARRIRIRNMVVFVGSNLTGASQSRSWEEGAAWTEVGSDGTRAQTLDRICAAPTTGQRLN